MKHTKCYKQPGGIKVRDRVKVLRKANSYEMGWCDTWEEDMDAAVGHTSTVISMSDGDGVCLSGSCRYFPFFVLEKLPYRRVTKAEAVEILSNHFGEPVEIVED